MSHEPSAYGDGGPYGGPYAADPYAADPYAADAYGGEAHGEGRGDEDPYATEPYGADPYATAPYNTAPYNTAPYSAREPGAGAHVGAGSYGPWPAAPGHTGAGAHATQPGGGDTYGEAQPHRDEPYGGAPYGAHAYGAGAAEHGIAAYAPGQYATEVPIGGYDEPVPSQRSGTYEAAVDALNDPLTDPLPGQGRRRAPASGPAWGTAADSEETQAFSGHTSPWFRTSRDGTPRHGTPRHGTPRDAAASAASQGGEPLPTPGAQQPAPWPQQRTGAPVPQSRRGQQPPDFGAQHGSWQSAATTHGAYPVAAAEGPTPDGAPAPSRPGPVSGPSPVSPAGQDWTGSASAPVSTTESPDSAVEERAGRRPEDDDERRTVGLRRPEAAELGRAARRKAAAGKQQRPGQGPNGSPSGRAGTRLEARRAARAAKDGPVVVLSRFIGEVFITLGVLMLLFVSYQLWWTNVLADQQVGKAANELTDRWEKNPKREPGAFSPGQGFAIMYIPKLDVQVPIAEGVGKERVLDKGLVGHYDESSGLETAMPWDKRGNFALAGHRNTHGEPFRYINQLEAEDEIIVETADTYYTYRVSEMLPSTSPSNTSVIEPVPPQSGFERPGRYITLTTCTPEFTSKYRLIVWGKMVQESPRGEGKPDALVN